MDQALHRVSISGSTLAHILQDFSSSSGDSDGILFGYIHTEILSRIEDDDDQCGLKEEINAVITGFCSSGSSFGFYDACGRPDPSKLANLLGHREERDEKKGGKGKDDKGHRARTEGGEGYRGGREGKEERKGCDPMIGWFMGRRNTPMRPSLREMAVTKGLVASRISNHGDSSTLRFVDTAHTSLSNMKESPMSSPRQTIGDLSSPIDVDSSPSDSGNTSNSKSDRDKVIDRGFASADSSVQLSSKETVEKANILSPKETMEKSTVQDVVSDTSSVQFNSIVSTENLSPFLFMLFTESGIEQAIHTHDYRVYQYYFQSQRFEPRMLKIVNIGPAFRGNYDSFSPVVPFPLFPMPINSENEGESESDLHNNNRRKTWPKEEHDANIQESSPLSNEQTLLDVYSEGYKVERLARLLEPNGMLHVSALEDLYSKMLLKLETLAKQVSDSSSLLLKQEMYNAQLRKDTMHN